MTSFKFSLVSDLHVDHPQPKTPYHLLEKHVVVAGDTSNGLLGTKFLQKLKNKGHEVFAVDGNHEHYSNLSQGRSHRDTMISFYEAVGVPVTILDVGLQLVGANGWYLVSDEEQWADYMNDSRSGCLTAAEVNQLAEAQAKAIGSFVRSFDGPSVVVTHTAPCEETLDPRYFGYFSNEWYWNPHMRQVMADHRDKILVWCHGHTHTGCDRVVDGVRVVCNPRGYPRENPEWTPKTVEVEW